MIGLTAAAATPARPLGYDVFGSTSSDAASVAAPDDDIVCFTTRDATLAAALAPILTVALAAALVSPPTPASALAIHLPGCHLLLRRHKKDKMTLVVN